MDQISFIHPRFVVGTTVEAKVLQLLNSFTTIENFEVITDRPGFGFATNRKGFGIGEKVAQRILNARPDGGFTSIKQIADWDASLNFRTVIDGFGSDKFSDLVVSAIVLSQGIDHRTVRGNFRKVNPEADSLANATARMLEPIDVIAYCRFTGSALDIAFPIQLVETDANGDFVMEHVTNDYMEFALVARFRDNGEVFHRSGLIPIQSFPINVLVYEPILLNQEESITDASFRTSIEAQVGQTTPTGETIVALTSDLKEDLIEIKGEIVAPDTFLFFDSNITFTSHVNILGTQYASNWPRDLSSLIGINSRVVEQNHSNIGFIVVSVLAFGIPVVGIALGSLVSLIFYSIDSAQDSSFEIKMQIADALKEKLGEEALEQFAEIIREQVENADLTTLVALTFLSSFEEPPADTTDAIIDFMIEHKTVQHVVTDTENVTFNIWLTLPFFIPSN